MTQRRKLTPEERLKALFVRLTASLVRLTALETNPRIRKAMTAGFIQAAIPPKPAAQSLLTQAMLAVDMEEYECRLRAVDNA